MITPTTRPRPTRHALSPVTVYSCFDSDGRPLYVGCTSRQYVRFGGHGNKDWWTDVHQITVRHFEDKQDGLREERRLIQRLRPLHNVAQHPDRDLRLLDDRRRIPALDRMYREMEKAA